MDTIITLTNVRKEYKMGKTTVEALRGVDLTLQRGGYYSVIGPSGSGKSTLLHIVGCMDTPTEGQVWVNGTDVSQLDERALIRILQEPKNSLIKQYQKLFELENVKLTFTNDAICAIAQKSLERETGARGIRAIIENIMLDIMFDIPSQNSVKECVVNEDVILKGENPIIVYEKAS